MVSNLALKCKATDKTEITVSSGKKKKNKKRKEVMDVNSLFCLCSKMIISDVEKLNLFCFLVFKSLEILLLLFVFRSFLSLFFFFFF